MRGKCPKKSVGNLEISVNAELAGAAETEDGQQQEKWIYSVRQTA
jgi:hypothetical protein